jgi:hypothetical protein
MMAIHIRTHFCLPTAIDDGTGTLVGIAVKGGETEGARNDSAGCNFVPPFRSNGSSFLSKCSDDKAVAKQRHRARVALTMKLSCTTSGTLFLLTNTTLVNVPRIKTIVLTCESTSVYFHAVSLQQEDW